MPASCANALRPVIALFGCTGTLVISLSNWLAGYNCSLATAVSTERSGAYPHRHHNLLERRVPRALADSVDRALHLARARIHGRQRVRHRQTEVVVAMRRDRYILDSPYPLANASGSDFGEFAGHRVTHRVRNIQRWSHPHRPPPSALGTGNRGPCASHLPAKIPRPAHNDLASRTALAGLRHALLARNAQLVLQVNVGGCQERHGFAGAPRPSAPPRRARCLACKPRASPAMIGTPDGRSNRLHRFKVAFRGDRESGFDHVHAQPVKLPRHAHLLAHVHAATRRLLAIPQSRVEYRNPSRSIARNLPEATKLCYVDGSLKQSL